MPNSLLKYPNYMSLNFIFFKKSVILAILSQDRRVVMNMGSGGRPGLSVPALALANSGGLGQDT